MRAQEPFLSFLMMEQVFLVKDNNTNHTDTIELSCAVLT